MESYFYRSLVSLILVIAISACGSDSDDRDFSVFDDDGVFGGLNDGSDDSGVGGGGVDDISGVTIVGQCATVRHINPSGIVIGDLNGANCNFSDVIVGTLDTTLVDAFLFTVSQGGAMRIELNSSDFDAFLYLYRCSNVCGNFSLVTTNDNGGVANPTDAVISMDIIPGNYMILANFVLGSDSSPNIYTLTTQFR